ncbi:MAG: Acyl-CoA hydrolase (EC [uncultured Caballeronia sp.]|nr:MAG: Acyl-CoA hydrolase (EC [uncultured Caballeronia sp.]
MFPGVGIDQPSLSPNAVKHAGMGVTKSDSFERKATSFNPALSRRRRHGALTAGIFLLFHGNPPVTQSLQLPNKPVALRIVPQPSDANVHGDVFGG